MQKNNHTPLIRFLRFTDMWEWRKVEEYASFLTSHSLSKADISSDGQQECILYCELYTNYGMIADKVISKTNAHTTNPVLSKKGDVLIPASGWAPAELTKATSIERSDVLLGSDITIIRPHDDVVGSCLSLALNVRKTQLSKFINGILGKHIASHDIKNIEVCMPESRLEQQKIAALFKHLITLFALHQQQTEKFVELEKGLLLKMFPHGDSPVPQYRFPGFVGHLKPEKLKEVANLLMGHGNFTKRDLSPLGGTECITSSNLYTDYRMGIDRIIYKTNKCINNLVRSECDDVLIPVSGYSATALSRAACIIRPRVLVNGDVIIVRSCGDINGYYLCAALNVNKIQLMRLVQGLVGKNIPVRFINDIELLLPESCEEQSRVGIFFKFWDRLINAHERGARVLSQLEVVLLHAMFPNGADENSSYITVSGT